MRLRPDSGAFVVAWIIDGHSMAFGLLLHALGVRLKKPSDASCRTG
jgi:hypothetical protein